ncbi:MAG TPA: DUF1464 family protein [Gemmatimonadales bacterium]|jgi:predicted butyrate kinase (DUF1464 family)
MPRVIGIDPGTITVDLCGLDGGRVWLDLSLPTREALNDPVAFLALLREGGPPDLIAGPSGYGLPLVAAQQASETDLRLALLSGPGEPGGIGGLRQLARTLATSGLPVLFTPGVIHLPSVPPHRKLNRVDLGTADKVAAAALGVWDQGRRLSLAPQDVSFIMLELGGAFTAALAVDGGAIVDGMGGTSGAMGWLSAGAWDGEVAFLAGGVTKEMLFHGGRTDSGDAGLQGYVESAFKAALSLTASAPRPREILLSGRHAADPEVRLALEPKLATIAPISDLRGFASRAKQGAQGAALIADGLAGGEHRGLVDALRLREASGTVLDHLKVIDPGAALGRLGAG